MKRPIFILLLVLACSLLLAQTWQRTYPWADVCPYPYSYASADVYNVIPAIGGGYLMQGYAEFSGQDYLIMMTNIFWKIAENGDVVWRRTGDFSLPFNAIDSNGVDRYFALYGEFGDSKLFVYDEDLSLVTHIDFNPQYGIINSLADMVVVDDGIVFAGRRSAANGWFLMKIDFDYNLVWSKEIVNDIPDNGCESLKVTNEGGFIGVSMGTFAEFNAIGDTLWTYNTVGLTRCCDCLQMSDNQIYILGVSPQSTMYKLYLVDSSAHTISAISDGLIWTGDINENPTLIATSDGSLIFLAHTPQGSLHKYTQTGEYIWSREYIGIFGIGSKNMFCSESDNIVFCMGDINSHLSLIKADSSGNVVANDDPIAPKPEVYLSHYPNPVHGIVDIRYDIPYQRGQLRLEIVNIKGQKIFTKELNSKSGEFRWDGCNQDSKPLKSGIYIYCLTVDRKVLKSNKMIIIH